MYYFRAMAETPHEPTDRKSNVVYTSRLFRVQEVRADQPEPCVFVDHIGAVTILPIAWSQFGDPVALTLDKKRHHDDMRSRSLPSGDLQGDFEHPEDAIAGAIRQLGEETGYAPRDQRQPNIEMFAVPGVSTAFRYPRMFMIMRDLVHQEGLKQEGGSEDVTLKPTSAEVYVDQLILAEEELTYPDVHLAFMKANRKVGRDAVNGWLLGDISVSVALEVPEKFEPWVQLIPDIGQQS